VDEVVEYRERRIDWCWDGKSVSVGFTAAGDGPTVLLLPSLSSISTRCEMRPLQERIGLRFRAIAVDWPGFGDLPRPKIAWRPDTYRGFLSYIAAEFKPSATIAAGHAAGYAIAHSAEEAGSLGLLILLSPTWRGPLPTMVGKRLALFRWISQAVDLPVVGHVLYHLNINKPVIRMMARGHVYADRSWLTLDRLKEKLAVATAPGARFASFRFVAGELDPFQQRSDFLDAASRINTPVQIIFSAQCPRKSKAEMIALAALSNFNVSELPLGKLSIFEEHPEDVAPIIEEFLRSNLRPL
jgi:pimeloyl-ACP methyl ester carboxylesterase